MLSTRVEHWPVGVNVRGMAETTLAMRRGTIARGSLNTDGTRTEVGALPTDCLLGRNKAEQILYLLSRTISFQAAVPASTIDP